MNARQHKIQSPIFDSPQKNVHYLIKIPTPTPNPLSFLLKTALYELSIEGE